MVCSKRWLEKEKRRGGVFQRHCLKCGKLFWLPPHLKKAQWHCEDHHPPEEAEAIHEAAKEWRYWHTISPLIEPELERDGTGR